MVSPSLNRCMPPDTQRITGHGAHIAPLGLRAGLGLVHPPPAALRAHPRLGLGLHAGLGLGRLLPTAAALRMHPCVCSGVVVVGCMSHAI